MNKELMEALDVLEKEKEISKETLFEAIENSLMTACKNHFGKADNVHVEINRETCDFLVYAEKEVVPTKDDVEDDCLQIALEDAKQISHRAQVGDIIHVEIKSKEFGRIATQNAKNVILQKMSYSQLDAHGYMVWNCLASGQKGYYITNGKAIPISWTKTSDTGRTIYYDTNGDEITINTGKTYIGFVADDVWDELVIQ